MLDKKIYARECQSDEWAVDVVHAIPKIHKFMQDLGGCTKNGHIFWRSEEKDVAS